MSDPLSQLLDRRPWLLADGATGTALFNMGLTADTPAESWNATNPEAVRAVYRRAIEAGSDLVLTNSYGGNAARLRLHGAEGRVGELNRLAAEHARAVADASGRTVVVAGCIGPTGEIMAPMGAFSRAVATEMFHQQAEALKAGGADILWIETIGAIEELAAAAEAARLTGMAWCVTMNFDTAGRTMMGVTPAQMSALINRLPHLPVAQGANCGVGMADLLRSVVEFTATGSERPLIAKGNAGVPHVHDGRLEYDASPAMMADYAVLARALGARIIGGCCGTGPQHLRVMREALEDRPAAGRPSLEVIAQRFGGFSTGLRTAPTT